MKLITPLNHSAHYYVGWRVSLLRSATDLILHKNEHKGFTILKTALFVLFIAVIYYTILVHKTCDTMPMIIMCAMYYDFRWLNNYLLYSLDHRL